MDKLSSRAESMSSAWFFFICLMTTHLNMSRIENNLAEWKNVVVKKKLERAKANFVNMRNLLSSKTHKLVEISQCAFLNSN